MAHNIKGVRLNLLERGQGRPVLFLHGNPDSAQLWAPVIEDMRSRFRCLAPDLPGFGHSISPRGFDFSLVNMADFLRQLLDAAQVSGPVDLVAHDIGGMYGVAFAIRHPGRVRRMVLSNTAFSSRFTWHRWAQLWRTPVGGELSMLVMNRHVFVHEMRRGSVALSGPHLERTWSLISPATRRAILAAYRALRPANFRGWEEQLPALAERTPTQVLWGEQDPYIPLRFAESFGAHEVHTRPDSGHWLPAEQPEFFAREAARFLGQEE